MKHTEIDALVKSWIVDAADKPANPRVQQIVLRLVGDLCKTIEDLDISATEFSKLWEEKDGLVFILRGLPGSGKSTEAQRLKGLAEDLNLQAAIHCTFTERLCQNALCPVRTIRKSNKV